MLLIPIVVMILRTVPVERMSLRNKSAMMPLVGTKMARRVYGIAENMPFNTIDCKGRNKRVKRNNRCSFYLLPRD